MNTLTVSKRALLLTGAAILGSSILLMAQAGALDPTFGAGGIVTTSFGSQGTPETTLAAATAIQSDGKILVAGSVGGEAGVVRYTTNGTLDSSFGTGGIVINSSTGPGFGLALQPDGKIVVGANGTTSTFSLEVIRYNTDGSLDTSFGTGGIASSQPFGGLFFGPATGGVAVEPDGKIMIAVTSTSLGPSVVARLLSNGQFDSSFGTDGAALLVSTVVGTALLPNGKSLVGAGTGFLGTGGGISRYTSTGSLDSTFGLNGQAGSVGPVSALRALNSGKFISGGAAISQVVAPPGTNTTGFALTCYNANGTTDSTFGTRGGVLTTFTGNTTAAAFALAVQSNGDVVAAGQAQASGSPSIFALARYTSSGQIDTTFGTNGKVTTSFSGNTAFVSALVIQADGKIVAVGNDDSSTIGSFAVARYLAQ
jgi:uncharacterized delta-60 repeat protein